MDDRRDFPPADLAQLVGSRLCHDLVNPISAIANGLELLALSGTAPSPELTLIGDAVSDALARIRFFRVAFGAARPGDSVSTREVKEILSGLYGSGRLAVDWQAMGDLTRADAKFAFLMINCVETALPMGGTIAISASDHLWSVKGTGRRINLASPNWDALTVSGGEPVPEAGQIQFALLAQETGNRGCTLSIQKDDTAGAIEIQATRL